MIDLISDTATRPSPEMRRAMAEAPVGDEQLREDPTVNRLQEMVAELTGKEAALFLPSGTMCNAIGIKVHTNPGDKIVLERWAHPYTSEAGGPGLLAGVMTALIEGERGVFTPEQVEEAVQPQGGFHSAPATLLCLENTHNRGGGKVWPLETFQAVAETAHRLGMKVHLDGARLLNAVVASGIPAKVWSQHVDTVWIDLSKGLGCPIGAVLAGDRETMERARRYKHMFGGAMRQAGIIAAAGVYALEHNVERLAEDHANAKLLAAGLSEIPGIAINPAEVETNIVFFDVSGTGRSPQELYDGLIERGVRMGSPTATRWRAVTHLDVSRADIERAVEVMEAVVTGRG
ncbi:GntG family PLP-dependent aldolase [Sphaerobacter sp.]|uniref:threonine aldolase family protein n=1 Tax=Sphaerobacter sp. TaxID=2099654 RepID=UPI001DD96E32|nr:GntG family PLP-dependent aldolase [Sphaerobacter sp.]MBX5445857.1 aminotransferase class I/II-fold pyridoxal phosphate-dependent enzyme [Sphaerobacter sp.]